MPNKVLQKITPGQALLLLIKHYEKDPIKSRELQELYLSGAREEEHRSKIDCYFKDEILSLYQIVFDAASINDDPTRRYFETHLAFESLKNGLNKVNLSDLESHSKYLYERVACVVDKPVRENIDSVLNGLPNLGNINPYKEYAYYIGEIRAKKIFPHFSEEERNKVVLLVRITFLGAMSGLYTKLPMDIYGTGIYSKEHRGKVIKDPQSSASTRSLNYGLMKGHMPLAQNDIARGNDEVPFIRPSEESSFKEQSQWAKLCFSQLVHPFSNSISGTILCKLRAHAQLVKENKGIFTTSAEEIGRFTQLLISTMLFCSGGHSLLEYIAPFELPAIRAGFKTIPGFESINLNSMFLRGNETAFSAAIEAAIRYNELTLMRQALNMQIKGETEVIPTNEATNRLKINQVVLEISQLAKQYDCYVKGQLFSSIRTGAKKNALIQPMLEAAIAHLQKGSIDEARKNATDLKRDIKATYGITNFWGAKSQSYQLVQDVEHQLSRLDIINNSHIKPK